MIARNSFGVVLALGGLAAAQFSLNTSNIQISQQCTTALTSILANSGAATCLSLGDVIPVLSLPQNTSLIPSVQTWLGDVCAAQACSNSTLDFVTSTLLQGCENDLITNGALPQGTTISQSQAEADVEQGYPPTREVACSKSNGNYCLLNTLNAVQTLLGKPLSVSTLMSANWVDLANTLDTSSLCTDCNQAAYATLKSQVPSVSGSQVEQVVASRCGSSFVSGGVPSDVTLGSGGSAAAASGAGRVGVAAAGLLGSVGLAAVVML